jgi:hypothetical protein
MSRNTPRGSRRPKSLVPRPPGAKQGVTRAELQLEVLPQPDDTTCGPTCLHAVYRYFGDNIELRRVIDEVPPLPGGGTLAVWLANHALDRNYDATIFTYNLQLFDPSWFEEPDTLAQQLRAQLAAKNDQKMALATEPYLQFLDKGGKVFLADKASSLIRRFLKKGIPILTGLSATYLYRCARELDDNYDATRGHPSGHFVVLSGYDRESRDVMVADPLHDNPFFGQQYYAVNVERLVAAILLGIVTYDANLLVLQPRGHSVRPEPSLKVS